MNKRFRPDETPQDFGFLNADGQKNSDVIPDEVSGREADVSSTEPPLPQAPAEPKASDAVAMASTNRNRLAVSTTRQAEPHDSAVADVPAVTQHSKANPILFGYASVVTLLLIYFMLTGKSSRLESLPDIRPLKGNEFQHVPEGTKLPDGHVMKFGESTRFGDVVVTPVKITREPLKFENFMTKAAEDQLTTPPVLKLHLALKNVASDYAFPPYDSGLMSHRSPPESEDDDAKANSFLLLSNSTDSKPKRFLNFLQSMDNTFLLTGQNSAKVIAPGETLETFVASAESINRVTLEPDSECVWRIQIRKGVHQPSGDGVTTLIDVTFRGSDVQAL